MADEEQLSILKQGVEVWNKWREENPEGQIDLKEANLTKTNLQGAKFGEAYEEEGAFSYISDLSGAKFVEADLTGADFGGAILSGTDFSGAVLFEANFHEADLHETNFIKAHLWMANFNDAKLDKTRFSSADFRFTNLGNLDLGKAIGLDDVKHLGPSTVGTNTIAKSRGQIPDAFLKGCGLSDIDIEFAKLYDPDLDNDRINKILYKIYDLRATQSIQISPLFISYSHADGDFVDKIEKQLNNKGVRFWRDIHNMKAGRIETQIDRAINQNRTVLLILSASSMKSDWVEHEVREARSLEKEMGRDVLCPVALDDSWKDSRWPKRIMEQIMEYNILDFSAWEDDSKFDAMFRKLIDGLELFYKG